MKRKTGSFAAPAFALSVALTQLFASTCLCNAFRTVVASSGGDGAPFWVVLGCMVTMTTFRLSRPFTYSMRPWWTIGLLSPLAAWFRAKRPGKGSFTTVLELLVRRLRFRCVGWLVFLWLHTLLPSRVPQFRLEIAPFLVLQHRSALCITRNMNVITPPHPTPPHPST